MGKIIVDAAARAGVRHFIFSSGPDSETLTKGKVKMNAADSAYYYCYSPAPDIAKLKQN
jgi:hypothetical protein